MNKTTLEALKLVEEALEELHYSSGTVKAVTLYKSAIAAVREVLANHSGDANEMVAEPVKQEPVAYVTGYYGGRCVVEPLNRASVLPNNLALYAAPVDAKAIRAEALEEAAKWCEENGPKEGSMKLISDGFAQGIRRLK